MQSYELNKCFLMFMNYDNFEFFNLEIIIKMRRYKDGRKNAIKKR